VATREGLVGADQHDIFVELLVLSRQRGLKDITLRRVDDHAHPVWQEMCPNGLAVIQREAVAAPEESSNASARADTEDAPMVEDCGALVGMLLKKRVDRPNGVGRIHRFTVRHQVGESPFGRAAHRCTVAGHVTVVCRRWRAENNRARARTGRRVVKCNAVQLQ
jgi:hypothetical protein